jgi:hypothetical protein
LARYCPRCGAPVNPSVTFCPNCGVNMNSSPAQYPPTPQYAPLPPYYPAPQKKPTALLVVAIIVLVFVIIIVSAAMLGINISGANNQGGSDTTPAVDNRTASDYWASFKVNSIDNPADLEKAVSYYSIPSDGKHFVAINITLTNKRSDNMNSNPNYWELGTSDGLVTSYTWHAANNVPEGLQSGASATFYITFEVANGATPTSLIYNDYWSELTVTL